MNELRTGWLPLEWPTCYYQYLDFRQAEEEEEFSGGIPPSQLEH